jgi:glycine cleavage system transcriptional repressor
MPSNDSHLVLSALASDRPGLVAELTAFLTERGANIEDSRMTVLGGEFGMMVLIGGPGASLDRIVADAPAFGERTGASILVRRTKSPEDHRRAATIPYVITADALDHEGIVRAVAHAIAELGINIVSLETSSYNAPVTGAALFRLEAQVDVPGGVALSRVRKTMDDVAQRENLDIEVRALTGG